MFTARSRRDKRVGSKVWVISSKRCWGRLVREILRGRRYQSREGIQPVQIETSVARFVSHLPAWPESLPANPQPVMAR
jgi:hypothetical protein